VRVCAEMALLPLIDCEIGPKRRWELNTKFLNKRRALEMRARPERFTAPRLIISAGSWLKNDRYLLRVAVKSRGVAFGALDDLVPFMLSPSTVPL
jgi:hypothetical protein